MIGRLVEILGLSMIMPVLLLVATVIFWPHIKPMVREQVRAWILDKVSEEFNDNRVLKEQYEIIRMVVEHWRDPVEPAPHMPERFPFPEFVVAIQNEIKSLPRYWRWIGITFDSDGDVPLMVIDLLIDRDIIPSRRFNGMSADTTA